MTERWLDIARKDFQYARRSYLVLAVIFVFGFLTVSIVAVPGIFTLVFGGEFGEAGLLFRATASVAGLVIPIISLVAAYLSVAGERQTGRLRLLLVMPPTRLDVVIGKFVARSAIIVLAIVVAYAVASVASLVFYRTVPVVDLLWLVGLTGLLGVAFVGIAVGISAATGSRAIAMASAVGFFVLSIVLWPLFTLGMQALLRLTVEQVPDWIGFLDVVLPRDAYSSLVNSLVGQLGGVTAPQDAFYHNELFLVALLGVWVILPVAVGYLLFERADLS